MPLLNVQLTLCFPAPTKCIGTLAVFEPEHRQDLDPTETNAKNKKVQFSSIMLNYMLTLVNLPRVPILDFELSNMYAHKYLLYFVSAYSGLPDYQS